MTQEEILEILEETDAAHIDIYLDAVMNRKMELYPDRDIIYLASPKKDPAARKLPIRKLQEAGDQ